ncbi:energy transducer TonB [Pleionea mediterranea]|uniref:Protein TonB n=1 Tax=Pleionea mediterranea TaxID=523701 RepID=A0A316FUE8_9GAMM|nr:energy transducer TonB [Pleionea mediterranea]PWK51715.1 outer membrane transport energization protein TonB [Pleionea mediterranea]
MRYVNAVIIAVVVTAALFFTMRALIESGDATIEDSPERRVLEFVEVERDQSVEKKQRKPKKPPKPEQPPPEMEQPQMEQTDMINADASMSFAANIAADNGLKNGMSLDASDGEYLPIVKVAPIYPRRALSRGIEGYVIVEFTVTPQGTVVSPEVVEAEPEGIFERAAMDAAKKFKYKPRMVDGKAVSVPGVQNQITFKMKR